MLKKCILKKIYISIILMFFMFLCGPVSAECIWVNKNNGLSGHEFTSLAVDQEDSNTIYAGSRGLLFKTSDGGENWKDVFKVPGMNKAVNFIMIHPHNPKIIYVATESGVFKSDDSGIKWQAIPIGAEGDNVLTLIIDPENSETLFAAAERDIFVSKDSGKNWVRSSQGLSAINIRSLTQNYIDREILFASAENGLFRSTDGAGSWVKIFSLDSADNEDFEDEESESSASPARVSIDPFDPEIIYLSAKEGIFKSENGGDSWKRLPKTGLPGTQVKNLVFPSYNKGFIFAATENGVFRFSEKEDMWKDLYAGLPSKKTVFVALNSRQDVLWLATKNGVFKSKGDIYEVKEISALDEARTVLENFSNEPSFREIQEAAIEYAEVHPEKIAKWRRGAKTKALLPRFSFRIDQDKGDYYYYGERIGEDKDTGWDITCTWDLGGLIWNSSQTLIDVRSKLMVQLRDNILDEVTRLYFERRRLQIELHRNPPENVTEFIEKKLRLQELTADIDAMTGGYLSREVAKRKAGYPQ